MQATSDMNFRERLLKSKCIVKYIESSYFGDSDIFARFNGLDRRGRDSTAICQKDSTVFVMNLNTLEYIKTNFRDIYIELEKTGVKKYKIHQIRKYN